MIRNYLLVALRNFRRNKLISLINVFGLAVAMTATLVILQFVSFHLDFDRTVLSDWENIHRLGYDWHWNDSKGQQHLEIPGAWDDIITRLPADFPEIETSTWFMRGLYHEGKFDESVDRVWIYPDENFGRDPIKVKNFISADSNYFKVFDYPMQGQRHLALSQPNSAVLSLALADELFPSGNAIGQMIYLDGKRPIQITGTYDPSTQSTLNYDLILSVHKRFLWPVWGYEAFFKTVAGVNRQAVYKKIASKFSEYHATTLKQFSNLSPEVYPIFQRLDDLHFDRYANIERLENVTYSRSVFYVLLAIGLVISGIALANYFNLTNAQLISRIQEVGVRKAIGATDRSLFLQGLLESLIMMIIAFVFAITLSQLTQPYLVGMGIDMGPNYLYNLWWFFPLVAMTMLTTAALTAIVKTLLISRVTIISIFRGTVGAQRLSSPIFQKILLGTQFTCTVALIIAIVIVHNQVGFIMDHDKGYNASQTIVIDAPQDNLSPNKIRPFMNALRRLPAVESVCGSWSYPGENHTVQNMGMHYREGKKGSYGLDGNGPVSASFIDHFQVEVVAGRNFRQNYPPDQEAILLSEHAVQRLEFKSNEEALNATVYRHFEFDADTAEHNKFRVIGIFKDYYVFPLHEIKENRGMAMTLADELQPVPYRYFHIKVKTDNFRGLVANVKQEYNAHFVNSPFDFFLLGESQREDYAKDELLRSILLLFTTLAIILSFLGLFALLSLLMLSKTKEIGIRKIMGASIVNLFPLYARSYVLLVIGTSLIAIPAIWWLATQWLNGYAVRIELSWTTFALPVIALVAMILALLFAQIYRVTRANPSQSLRYE